MPSEKYYKVNEFAKLCGVTPRTLKYYETRGLIRPALVGENGYRYYSLSQIDEISAILLFRDYGFSLEEIKTIMEQDDLAGIEQRMGMMLSIIKEQKRKLEQQAKNIRYTCTQVAEARKHLGEPFLQNREPQRIAFEPVALMKDQSFVINYLTDGLRNGTAFGSSDLTVKGRYQTEPSGPEILSGKGMCLYEMGFPQHETVEKVFTAARAAGLSPESVYCEMVLENVVPEKCLFQYFTAERSQI